MLLAHLHMFCRGPSPEVVAGLAVNVREKLDSTFTLCESGTAGPRDHTFAGTLARNRTPSVMQPLSFLSSNLMIRRGYVALAIASSEGVVTREVETGSDIREINMVAFAEAGLKFLRDVLNGDIQVGKL